MVGLDHGPSGPAEPEDVSAAARNARVGLVLFVAYLLLYGVFVGVSAFRPEWMAVRPWAEVNLAIWYGFALIGAALGVALVYSWLCRARAES